MITEQLLSEVLQIPNLVRFCTSKECLENTFGYSIGLRTKCLSPLNDDETITLRDITLAYGVVVLVNGKEVFDCRTINIDTLGRKCKEWALTKNMFVESGLPHIKSNISSF